MKEIYRGRQNWTVAVTDDKGGTDKNIKTSNKNSAQGEQTDDVRTTTSYIDPVWNAFSQLTDGSLQWIPKQIVAIGEDFHSQVGDDEVKTTLFPPSDFH